MDTLSAVKQVPSCGLGESASALARERLGALAQRPWSNIEDLIESAFSTVAPILPSPVLNSILALRRLDSRGSLVIRGLPVDPDLPPTPTTVTPDLRDAFPIARSALLGTVQLLGEAFAYRNEYDSEIITHVLPSRSGLDTVSSQGSRAVLPYHTEDVHLSPFLPDYLALMCLRPDPQRLARTCLVHAADVRSLLPAETVEILSLPLFHVRTPVSFGGAGGSSAPIPVFSGPREQPQIAAEFTDMVGLTRAAVDALAILIEASNRAAVEVDLDRGDLLLIDNRRVLHGRTPFEPLLDGTDRWCVRVLVRAGDLWDWRLYVDERRVVL
jgi:L-asparagine oxygenase